VLDDAGADIHIHVEARAPKKVPPSKSASCKKSATFVPVIPDRFCPVAWRLMFHVPQVFAGVASATILEATEARAIWREGGSIAGTSDIVLDVGDCAVKSGVQLTRRQLEKNVAQLNFDTTTTNPFSRKSLSSPLQSPVPESPLLVTLRLMLRSQYWQSVVNDLHMR